MRKTSEMMQATMKGLTEIYPGLGIVLLLTAYGSQKGRRTNYVSNCERSEILTLLKEVVAKFEGRVQETSTKQ